MATNYDELYANDDNVCGAPFKELTGFFNDIPHTTKLNVLDAGCGQGRDTLFVARLGHTVHAIDTSPNGIQQLLAVTAKGNLNVSAEVADTRSYSTKNKFDIVLIDRVLHMLAPSDRVTTLSRYAEMVAPNGYLLIMDTPTNIGPFSKMLDQPDYWKNCLLTKNALFSQRLS